MFQATNQITTIFPLLFVYSLIINHYYPSLLTNQIQYIDIHVPNHQPVYYSHISLSYFHILVSLLTKPPTSISYTVIYIYKLPSGKLSYNYGKSPFLMGKNHVPNHQAAEHDPLPLEIYGNFTSHIWWSHYDPTSRDGLQKSRGEALKSWVSEGWTTLDRPNAPGIPCFFVVIPAWWLI